MGEQLNPVKKILRWRIGAPHPTVFYGNKNHRIRVCGHTILRLHQRWCAPRGLEIRPAHAKWMLGIRGVQALEKGELYKGCVNKFVYNKLVYVFDYDNKHNCLELKTVYEK